VSRLGYKVVLINMQANNVYIKYSKMALNPFLISYSSVYGLLVVS
jgi:hypothetical protein